MQIIGIDFTSRPKRHKPITALHCTLEGRTLTAENLEEWSDFEAFEAGLNRPGPWVAGIDFPFGQSRRFIETIGWPTNWPDYVRYAQSLGRAGFRDALTVYCSHRPTGDKEHRRLTDLAAGSISPQKLFGVPVGLMFFEGAQRLIESGATIPFLQQGDPNRIIIEAYPGIIARKLIGRRTYKNDTKRKQTDDQFKARKAMFAELEKTSKQHYGFAINADDSLCDDPGGDTLDALLCATQAAWAWQHRHDRYGAPANIDPLEGWIADPSLAGNE